MHVKQFVSQKYGIKKIWQKFYIFKKFLSQKLGRNLLHEK